MTLANPVGMFIAFLIQGIFAAIMYKEVSASGTSDELYIIRENIYRMLFVENIIITFMVFYFFVFFRSNAPPTPPSFAAMRNHSSIT